MYDVIIIGLGAMGSSTAYHLSGRGKNVLGLEQYERVHDQGSSHGETRVIRQAYFEDPAYVPLLLRAYELWEALERDSGQDLLHKTGGLMIGTEDSEVVAGSRRAAEEHGLPYQSLSADDIRERFPLFAVRNDDVALFEENAGFVLLERSIAAHLDLAAQQGADLRFDIEAKGWRVTDRGGVAVETDDGTYEAEQLVITAGTWAPELLGGMELPLTVTRQPQFWFWPQVNVGELTPDRFPVYAWQVGEGQLYGLPYLDLDHDGIKIALHERGGETAPDSVDREIHDADIAHFREAAEPRVPRLAGELIHASICMYTNTPDGHFVLTTHPQHEQVHIGTGFSGHGYKFASVVGEIMADLATDGQTRHPVEPFQPERFGG